MARPLDWIRILSEQGIPFITEGPHTTRNNVSVNCPFCDYDEKYFMGISLAGEGYSCWYSHDHSGRNPVRLLQALLHTSYKDAQRILSEYTGVSLSDFSGIGESTFAVSFDKEEEAAVEVALAPEFKKISTEDGACNRFTQYLVNRGFRYTDVDKLADTYSLQYSAQGDFAGRVVIPVYDDDGLATWTARAIGTTDLRYKSLSSNREMSGVLARKSIKHMLLHQQDLDEGGKVLVVTEGPLDSLKLDMYGRSLRVRCTCLFGKVLGPEQADLIRDLTPAYDSVYFILDEGTGLEDVSMSFAIPHAKRIAVPYGVDDLGALSWKQARKFARALL